MSEPLDDPAAELFELTCALRAHVEALSNTGALGVPPGEPLGARPPTVEPPAVSARPSTVEPREVGALSRTSQPQPQLPQPPASPRSRAAASPQENASSEARAPAAPPGPPASPPPLASPTPTPEERARNQQQLEVLRERVRSCEACGLHRARTNTVFARGSGASGLCFVGEGPGADEDREGAPFVGKAGKLLDRMIAAMGFERDEVYVCNIVKCRPPDNRKPEPQEMSSCAPFLKEQLSLVQPRVIVALGATAVQGLLGSAGGITRIRGRWRLYNGRVPVMPTFHPAYLLRNPRAKRDVWDDLQEVLRHIGREVPARD